MNVVLFIVIFHSQGRTDNTFWYCSLNFEFGNRVRMIYVRISLLTIGQKEPFMMVKQDYFYAAMVDMPFSLLTNLLYIYIHILQSMSS